MSQHLKNDLEQKYVKARILIYFEIFDELVQDYGLSNIIENNDKLKCKLLAENLRPTSLREQVQLCQDLGQTAKRCESRPFDMIKAEALKNQQSFDLYQSNRDRLQSKPRGTVTSRNKQQNGSRPQQAREERPTMQAIKKRDDAPVRGCLHCKGPLGKCLPNSNRSLEKNSSPSVHEAAEGQ
ncbi:unnamed protein product [Phytophthora fragariaefolia]|uniref:Unnamed protein product n=1 Tax=Phytophthora fragariaefolia TaxID=1490495 RepID=A0A9W6XVX9_9STRA|nr:unnamed protein product [Phytophthora fragariaefolia]